MSVLRRTDGSTLDDKDRSQARRDASGNIVVDLESAQAAADDAASGRLATVGRSRFRRWDRGGRDWMQHLFNRLLDPKRTLASRLGRLTDIPRRRGAASRRIECATT
jgi:hypothetical protein